MGNLLAKHIALELFSQPALARRIRQQPLPEGMLEVIQIAAGNSPSDRNQLSQDAAIFFLQQVLISRDNDNFRLLGLNHGASLELVREHRRWLLKWLHPDRNHNKWESTLFDRVNLAATQLENPILSIQEPKTKRNQIEHKSRRTQNLKTLKVRRLVPVWKIILHLFQRAVTIALIVFIAYLGMEKLGLNQKSGILSHLVKGLEN